jgi:hypothetical protein
MSFLGVVSMSGGDVMLVCPLVDCRACLCGGGEVEEISFTFFFSLLESPVCEHENLQATYSYLMLLQKATPFGLLLSILQPKNPTQGNNHNTVPRHVPTEPNCTHKGIQCAHFTEWPHEHGQGVA